MEKNASGSPAAKKYGLAFILITSLFFFWGFVHNLDPILIKHLRSAFSLTHFQASLVDSAVFIAYFLLAIPAGMIMKRFGYKTGIIVGLFLFALGCLLFIPAANTVSYMFFLGALFILSCGLTILETAANPYITILGDPAKATQRLNFAQSFNGLAAFIAPIIGGKFILADEPKAADEIAAMSDAARQAYIQAETALVKMPYLTLGIIILVVAVLFMLTKLPDVKDAEAGDGKSAGFMEVLKFPRVKWAVMAQFFYVGAQVYVFSFLLVFAEDAINMKGSEGKYYAGLAGLLFMVGRFVGSFLMKYIRPSRLLAIYSVISMLFCCLVIFGNGIFTLYTLTGVTFFMSIMFPTIFALGVEGLGVNTKPASSLIIMSIVGGAILPPLASKVTDMSGNIHWSYIVPLICFLMVLLFALKSYKTQADQKDAMEKLETELV